MVLRNAFEDMATEATLASLVTALENLHRELDRQSQSVPPRALQYARDVEDRMRVRVDATAATPVFAYWGNANTNPTWYSTGAGTSIDQRSLLQEQSVANFNQVRQQRWVI